MRVQLIAAMSAATIAAACGNSVTAPSETGLITLPVQFSTERHVDRLAHGFRTNLSAREEVPANDSRARGEALFTVDGEALAYKLIVANIQNVTQAHIHCGAFGVNGPIVAWLYPSAPPATLIPGRSQGILNEGTITGADVIPRPDSVACPGGIANFDELVAKIRDGGAYVNVHTTQFPPGEIRGQLP